MELEKSDSLTSDTLQSYSNQDSMEMAQKQKHRLMKQDRKPRNKPIQVCGQLTYDKETRIYNEEKTVSSTSGAGKTGKLHVKE